VVDNSNNWQSHAPNGTQSLLDEPTEGIQPSIILQIEAAVRRIVTSTGISVLLVEQHLHFARQADHYYAMQKAALSPLAQLANSARM